MTFGWTLAFVSCNRTTPAGFWKNYRGNFIVKNISDQGPNGGHRVIYWKANETEIFNSKNVLEFANKNGWTLVDSAEFNQEQTNKWTYNNEPIFPLTFKGFSDTTLNDAVLNDFPRWFGGQIKIYKFKTGWTTVEPGTGNTIEDNGFVVLNNSRTEMAVYHLWGD